MSRRIISISEERKALQKKAEEYYQDLELAKDNLENSSKKLRNSILLAGALGLGFAMTYKLFFDSDKDESEEEEIQEVKARYKKPSRFGSALKSLAIPIIVGIAKNIILPDNKNDISTK